jgi:hypothetical protein
MGMRRTPLAKAILTGRVQHDRKRFRDRSEPEWTGELGPPPVDDESWPESRVGEILRGNTLASESAQVPDGNRLRYACRSCFRW